MSGKTTIRVWRGNAVTSDQGGMALSAEEEKFRAGKSEPAAGGQPQTI
jgi:hypothetical protein